MPRKNGRPDFTSYKAEPRVSLRKDVTRFLAWARNKAPGVFVSYPELVQRVTGYKKTPHINSNEVKSVRGVMSSVRKALMDDHGCGLLTDPALGVRATIDDIDMLSGQVVKASNRLRGAQDMFTRSVACVDINKVPNVPEYKAMKEWYKTAVVPVAKAIASADFAAKLLPPKREEV